MLLDAAQTLAPTSSTLPTSVGVAIAFGYLLDMAKRLKSIPKVTYYTDKLNFALRILLSGAGTLGVSWAWSHTATGGYHLGIDIPSLAVLGSGVWHWFVQYGMQHGFEIILQNRAMPANGKA